MFRYSILCPWIFVQFSSPICYVHVDKHKWDFPSEFDPNVAWYSRLKANRDNVPTKLRTTLPPVIENICSVNQKLSDSFFINIEWTSASNQLTALFSMSIRRHSSNLYDVSEISFLAVPQSPVDPIDSQTRTVHSISTCTIQGTSGLVQATHWQRLSSGSQPIKQPTISHEDD